MPNTWTSVSRQWSGKHKRVVQGINLTSLLWSNGDKHIPCNYRLYEKAVDGATKNDHFRAMLTTAHERGFKPKCVAFDSWCECLSQFEIDCKQWLDLADSTQAQSVGES
jgi:hypothetical protein